MSQAWIASSLPITFWESFKSVISITWCSVQHFRSSWPCKWFLCSFSPDVQHLQNLPPIAQQDHENQLKPLNDRLPSPDQVPPAVVSQQQHGEAWNILYDRRQPPVIDLEVLSHLVSLPKLRKTLEFINHLRNASFEDPIAKIMPTMLERLWNPPEAPIQLNNPSIQHSISTYLALENASQAAYERVVKSTKQNFPSAPMSTIASSSKPSRTSLHHILALSQSSKHVH